MSLVRQACAEALGVHGNLPLRAADAEAAVRGHGHLRKKTAVGYADALDSVQALVDQDGAFVGVAYDRPGQRGPLVQRLRAALPDKNLVELSLRDRRLDIRDQTSTFFAKLRGLADENAGEEDADVVLLTDWERLLDPAALRDEQATTTLTGLFNRGRESFKTVFPLPVVVLVTHDALAVIEERSPDFVSWKSGVFELADEDEEDDGEPPSGGVPAGEPDGGRRDPWEVFRGAAALDDEIFGRETDLEALLKRILPRPSRSRRLICDQFERVFNAIETKDERASFLEELARPVNDLELPFCCVFVVRADRLFHLFELDRWVPLHRPLATENLYELRYLRESDAVRVFEELRDASGSAWTEELLDHVVQELADDGRVRPVEIQLIAAGLYLCGVRTIDDYAAEGRKEGLLKGYLDGVLDELEHPELSRRRWDGLLCSIPD